jgi:hypothetical protein
MEPAHARGTVAVEVVGGGEVQLLGKVGDEGGRDNGWLGQEGASRRTVASCTA